MLFLSIGIFESVNLCNLFLLDIGFFRDKSVSGHSVTLRETVAVSSAEINGATAFEVSGIIMLYLCVFSTLQLVFPKSVGLNYIYLAFVIDIVYFCFAIWLRVIDNNRFHDDSSTQGLLRIVFH